MAVKSNDLTVQNVLMHASWLVEYTSGDNDNKHFCFILSMAPGNGLTL